MVSCCDGTGSVLRLSDQIRNLKHSNIDILSESGLNEKTLQKVLERAQKNYKKHGYTKKNEHRIEPCITAGTSFICPKTLGNYEVISQIGHGNSGIVFTCIQTEKGRHPKSPAHATSNEFDSKIMALKVMRLDTVDLVHRNLVKGFIRELWIHNYLTAHDPANDAKVLRFSRLLVGGPKHSYVGALSPLGSQSLSSLIKSNQVLSLRLIQLLFKKILQSLAVLESIGVTHSDLKCGNLLFDREITVVEVPLSQARSALMESEGWLNRREIYARIRQTRPKVRGPVQCVDVEESDDVDITLVDMGAGMRVHPGIHSICCAHHLRSPEDVYHKGDGAKRDIWALGLLMFELYTGYKWFPYIKGRYNTVEGWEMFLGHSAIPDKWRAGRSPPHVARSRPLEPDTIDRIEEHFADDDEGNWVLRVVKDCLVVNPEERLNATELLEKWCKQSSPDTDDCVTVASELQEEHEVSEGEVSEEDSYH